MAPRALSTCPPPCLGGLGPQVPARLDFPVKPPFYGDIPTDGPSLLSHRLDPKLQITLEQGMEAFLSIKHSQVEGGPPLGHRWPCVGEGVPWHPERGKEEHVGGAGRHNSQLSGNSWERKEGIGRWPSRAAPGSDPLVFQVLAPLGAGQGGSQRQPQTSQSEAGEDGVQG